MNLELLRVSSHKHSTLGNLFINNGSGKKFECFSLEDEYRRAKVMHETRIPCGRYKIVLRNEGGMNEKYKKKFGSFHKGMLWLQDVPDFDYVYIHYGNDDSHTSGCILVGETAESNTHKRGFVGNSVLAYKQVYGKVVKEIEAGDEVYIDVIDYDTPGGGI